METEATQETEVSMLRHQFLTKARNHLHIGTCFSDLKQFEERISAFPGVQSLRFSLGAETVHIASGAVELQFPTVVGTTQIGSWCVFEDGTAQVNIGAVRIGPLKGFNLQLALIKAWEDGNFREAIRQARHGSVTHSMNEKFSGY